MADPRAAPKGNPLRVLFPAKCTQSTKGHWTSIFQDSPIRNWRVHSFFPSEKPATGTLRSSVPRVVLSNGSSLFQSQTPEKRRRRYEEPKPGSQEPQHGGVPRTAPTGGPRDPRHGVPSSPCRGAGAHGRGTSQAGGAGGCSGARPSGRGRRPREGSGGTAAAPAGEEGALAHTALRKWPRLREKTRKRRIRRRSERVRSRSGRTPARLGTAEPPARGLPTGRRRRRGAQRPEERWAAARG